jgi:hypothetical protein
MARFHYSASEHGRTFQHGTLEAKSLEAALGQALNTTGLPDRARDVTWSSKLLPMLARHIKNGTKRYSVTVLALSEGE